VLGAARQQAPSWHCTTAITSSHDVYCVAEPADQVGSQSVCQPGELVSGGHNEGLTLLQPACNQEARQGL
jgi:hypothetical protein